jgi:hypothetical protein
MLLGLRLLKHLGASEVFLIGADFWMRPDYGYAFNQARTENASVSNNAQFRIVNKWLCEMQEKGVFERFGLTTYNCCRNSGLRAFPYVDFRTAVERCQGLVESTPDLSGWYEKDKEKDR